MEAALTKSRERLLELLGLGRDATIDAVKRRYRELARRYHPDVNPGDDRAHARFRAILAAYQQLLSQRNADPARAEPRPDSSQEIPAACSFVVPLPRVLMDEMRGRVIARRLGLTVAGTLAS
jgi:preprotein translocase subunit Sec63